MRFISDRSIATKMMRMVTLSTAAAVFILVSALLLLDRTSSKAFSQGRLTTLANVIGQNSAAAIEFRDPAAAIGILEALRSEPPVMQACLYDADGNFFAEYHRGDDHQQCSSDDHHVYLPGTGTPIVFQPIVRHGESVGKILMTSDMKDLALRRRWLLQITLVLLVGALAIAIVAGWILQRRITQPIFDLVSAMREVTDEQKFSTRVATSSHDEIALLGRGFNSMLSQLEQRDREKKEAQAKLEYQALNDALTGLPNRRLFSDRLAQVIANARRAKSIVALIYIDLDGFKLVNDSLGHGVGDSLLTHVANRLQSRVRQSDTLARLGGDEFTVILGSIHHKEEALTVANSLLDVLTLPFHIGENQITIGASIGITMFPENAETASDLLQQADSAMYAAKKNGKNQAMYFTEALGSMVRERMNLENQLRDALAKNEISVYYQPEFEVDSQRLIRFEALARWTHPTLGTIPPSKFIPVAEESGLIISLGAYVMEKACREAVGWQSVSTYPIQVAVNVSSIQFTQTCFVQGVKDILELTGLKPELLQIELTESVMLHGVNRSAETMKQLHELGIGLAIDDFGTGYSCLSYLPGLPFDALKIDRSFVHDMQTKPESKLLVRSLVALAHNIGMKVIVEGVERQDQLELIREFGGNEIQGFLLGRPTPYPLSLLGPTPTPLEEPAALHI